MPQQLRLPFLGTKPETPSVSTFRFALDGLKLDYQPGQYASVKLGDVTDPRGPMRSFTLSSSPTENELKITTRTTGRSPFKERFAALSPGDEVELRAAMGNFTLDTERPAVMMAGGIGITPFRSMIRYATDRALDLPIRLLYSSRMPDELAFKSELDEIASARPSIEVIYTITRPDDSSDTWDGRVGRFAPADVRAAADGLSQPLYYVCGSEAMVDGMTRMLADDLKIASDDIRSEDFPGY